MTIENINLAILGFEETAKECRTSKMPVYALDYTTEDDISTAIEALKRQAKYRWHDFRNDPQDLPECNATMVLAAMKEAYTGKIFYETFTVGFLKDFFCAQENNSQLIAWRLLEPFEVSE